MIQLKKTHKNAIADLAAYLVLALLIYTAASKFFTIDSFASTLARSPLIGSLNKVAAWSIPISEVIISLLLIVTRTRKWGLYAALILLIIFTIYLSYMVLSGSKLPCHCGGVVSTLSWRQHIWFNIVFILLAYTGAQMYSRDTVQAKSLMDQHQ